MFNNFMIFHDIIKSSHQNMSLAYRFLSSSASDEEFEPTPFVPSTFGARDNIYGAKMGKGDFSTKYLLSVMKNKIEPNDGLGRLLADTAKMKTFISTVVLISSRCLEPL